MNRNIKTIVSIFCALILSACTEIKIDFADTPSDILEDTVLIVSAVGDAPREVYVLGDVDLATLQQTVDQTVATEFTHWWLLGHIGGNTVFSSTADLTGVDLLAVEPYDAYYPFGAAVPANLDGYVNGTGYSLDWWATTLNNHHSHVTANLGTATLWNFGSAGLDIGSVTISLRASTSTP